MSTFLLKTWNQDQLATVASRKLYIFFFILVGKLQMHLKCTQKKLLENRKPRLDRKVRLLHCLRHR